MKPIFKKIMTFFVFVFLNFSNMSLAQSPLERNVAPEEWPAEFIQASQIKIEMTQMLAGLVSLAVPEKGDRMFENDLNREQAKRILDGIKAIKKLDKQKKFTKNLNQLEGLTKNLLAAVDRGEADLAPYSEKIFGACFNCHAIHRR